MFHGLTDVIDRLDAAGVKRDLSAFHVFLPRPDGRYERHDRALSYHE